MYQKHIRNTHFEWSLPTSSPQFLSTDQFQQFSDHGYCKLDQVFTAEEIAAVRAETDQFEAELEQFMREQYQGEGGTGVGISDVDKITFTVHLVMKSTVLKRFSCHPVFQSLCQDLIGKAPRLYWDQAVYKKPGNPEEFPWHQDNGYTFVEPQQYLTCWVPLVDATEENGCPWVIPGLQTEGTLKHQITPIGLQCLDNPEGAVCVPAHVGDVVVFSSLTPHRTGPNLTEATRKAYILQFAPDGAVAWPEWQGGTAELNPEGQSTLQNHPDRQYLLSEGLEGLD